ncbi:MAG: hypothetical protein QW733_02095 [Desulfurococcaceae archaeon]|uniref:hypothetical protein n=1 Tax=Desulfurococcus sp. TaxID=51678 RepID=UPI003169BBAD
MSATDRLRIVSEGDTILPSDHNDKVDAIIEQANMVYEMIEMVANSRLQSFTSISIYMDLMTPFTLTSIEIYVDDLKIVAPVEGGFVRASVSIPWKQTYTISFSLPVANMYDLSIVCSDATEISRTVSRAGSTLYIKIVIETPQPPASFMIAVKYATY